MSARRTIDGIYGMNPDYRAALDALCTRLGAKVYLGLGRDCTEKLHDRRHRCHHDYDARNWFHVDHDVWLRWPDGRYAILAQPYPGACAYELTDAIALHRLTVYAIGRAPYGHGTVGYLIVGRDAPEVSL